MDEHATRRIIAIATELLAGMVANGDVNPDDEAAMKRAADECARTARDAYFAALEFIS
jgi:hypothetical protein